MTAIKHLCPGLNLQIGRSYYYTSVPLHGLHDHIKLLEWSLCRGHTTTLFCTYNWNILFLDDVAVMWDSRSIYTNYVGIVKPVNGDSRGVFTPLAVIKADNGLPSFSTGETRAIKKQLSPEGWEDCILVRMQKVGVYINTATRQCYLTGNENEVHSSE